MRYTAIVIQCVSEHNTLVFSQAYGLHYLVHTARASRAIFCSALIAYQLRWRQRSALAHDVHVIAEPAVWAYRDIWFLHHVIEVLRHALCHLQPDPHVYHLITALYQPINGSQISAQRIFLVRLFFLLGIQPENVLHLESFMEYVAHRSFSTLLKEMPYTQHELCTWLHNCEEACQRYFPLQTKMGYERKG